MRLPERGSRSVLHDLHRQLRSAILEGRLQPGLRLPSTRSIAQTYGVSHSRRHGIGVRALTAFTSAKSSRAGLAFGFGAINEADIAAGVAALGRVLRCAERV